VATWHEFCGLAGSFGGEQVGENAWRFDVQGRGEGRTQKVLVFREVMQPDFEFIQVKAAFVMIETVNCAEVLKAFGQLLVGAIGYSPGFDANGNQTDGFLNISTSIPLAALDLSEPTVFFLYLNVLAQGADNLEQQLSAPGSPDLF
jgi:hypothetical protein